MAAKKAGAPATVTLKHLAANLSESHEMSKKQTEAVLGDLVGLVTKHLKKGDRIRIGGLGILQVRKRAARMGRNPATGEPYGLDPSGSHGGFAQQGVFKKEQPTRLTEIKDGTSNSFMVGEMSWVSELGTRFRSWIRGCHNSTACSSARNVNIAINTPGIATFGDMAFGSMHSGGTHFCMADGSVHFISETITLGVYKSLASRNGGEVAGLP